jgi:hypothetical protein
MERIICRMDNASKTDIGNCPAASCPARSFSDRVNPFNTGLMRGMKHLARTEPLWKVTDWAARRMNLQVEVRKGSICAEGPQIVICNTGSAMIGFSILSVLRRDDVYFIGTPGWLRVGHNAAEKCLPVFTFASFRENPKVAFRASVIYRLRDGVTPASGAEINQTSLTRAAKVVTGGGTLLVMPAGGTIGKKDNWKHGVGFILKDIGDVPAKVVFARVFDMRPGHIARMVFSPVFFSKPLVVPVEFSEPQPLSDFRDENTSVRQISQRLKDRYVQIYGSL